MATTPTHTKTSPFLVPLRFEAAYRNAILKLLYEEMPLDIGDNIDEWINKVAFLSRDEHFRLQAHRTATFLVRDINIHNVFSWRDIGRKVAGGGRIFPYLHRTHGGAIGETVDDLISACASSISDLPERLATKFAKQIEYARSQGNTEKGVANILKRSFVPSVLKRINLIAQTDPHKVNSALTEARSDDLSIDCFIWRTKHDSHVRPSHRRMDGIIIFWRDLPSPEALSGLPAVLGYYSPGNCPNCRCNPEPVISLEQIFPEAKSRAKVYYGDRVYLLTRAQFLQISD